MPGRVQTGHGHPVVWRAVMRIHDGCARCSVACMCIAGLARPKKILPVGHFSRLVPFRVEHPRFPADSQ